MKNASPADNEITVTPSTPRTLSQPSVLEATFQHEPAHQSSTGSNNGKTPERDYDGKHEKLEAVRSSATEVSITSTATPPADPRLPPRKPWYRTPNPLQWGRVPPVPSSSERIVSREHGASFFSRLTFQWMTPIMSTGYKRPLELNDVWKVNPGREVAPLINKLQASLKQRVARGDRRPLLGAIHETFFWEF